MNMTHMIHLPGRNFVVRHLPTAPATPKPWLFRTAVSAAPLQTHLLGPTGTQPWNSLVAVKGVYGRQWLH